MRVRVGNGTRREVLRGVLAAAVAAAAAPFVAASAPTRGGPYAPGGLAGGPYAQGGPAGGPSRELADFEARFAGGFDEMYGGCRIRGCKDEAAGGVRRAGNARTAPTGAWRVTVDDRPLHLMRRADGGYLTMIDHYQAYPTPLAAARAAVDELGGTLRLRAVTADAEPGEGHGHGVHA
ncbi:tyrosinase family oxidase copper chaperone [Streptomyces sp. NPDC047070]|uniref:tyrosinase family oxidase copper chaperone n=1 Tax=Streptomyces sp. NPDC047070 TaxID=3154923 RepID=UPI00345280DB